MKFTPVQSTSPKLLAQERCNTTTERCEALIEMVHDPRDGHVYLALGLGSSARVARAWLNKEQAQDYVQRLLPLILSM